MKAKSGKYLYIGRPTVFGAETVYLNDTAKLKKYHLEDLVNNMAVLFTVKGDKIVRVMPDTLKKTA